MSVTDRVVNSLKPKGKSYKKSVGGGLYIVVKTSGYKVWRYEYLFGGKPRTLTIGPYPAIGLADARERMNAAKAGLVDGVDPSGHKRTRRSEGEEGKATFEEVGREWYSKQSLNFSADHAKNVLSRLERIIYPAIGSIPVGEVKPRDLLDVVNPIEARGALETAHRVMQVCGNIFRYAIKLDLAERDITADMRGLIAPRQETHHPTITEPTKVGELMRAIDGFKGYFIVECALKLAPLVFVRPGELRGAEWDEFILTNSEWRIPPERMKMKELHIVPLSRQAMAIIMELKKATGNGKYLFPSIRTNIRTISENSVNAALRRLGYKQEEFTGHGFRSMASTLLNQLGWNKDWIERQLAHSERNSVRAAYNFADFLPQRQRMMQTWSDYLDELKTNTGQIPLVHERYGPQQLA